MADRDVPLLVDEWAFERAGMGGEESEHTLPWDPDDFQAVGNMQVWNDEADDDGSPIVALWGKVFAEKHEFRWDMSPDQALDLAAMLIVHAQWARDAAIVRALDE